MGPFLGLSHAGYSSLHFLLWAYVNDLAYNTPATNIASLCCRITAAIRSVTADAQCTLGENWGRLDWDELRK